VTSNENTNRNLGVRAISPRSDVLPCCLGCIVTRSPLRRDRSGDWCVARPLWAVLLCGYGYARCPTVLRVQAVTHQQSCLLRTWGGDYRRSVQSNPSAHWVRSKSRGGRASSRRDRLRGRGWAFRVRFSPNDQGRQNQRSRRRAPLTSERRPYTGCQCPQGESASCRAVAERRKRRCFAASEGYTSPRSVLDQSCRL
jgi:hypothetical protein